MATIKQKQASRSAFAISSTQGYVESKKATARRRNIKAAQKKWKNMTKRQHTLAQPQGRSRTKPGMGGSGRFYHIQVRPKSEFKSFRVQDVGKKGGLERLAGRRSSGSWDTVTWLVEKSKAHLSASKLIIDDIKVKTLLKQIRGPIKHIKGDIFHALPRRNVPEAEKPTVAMRRAQMANIKKAQAARNKI